MVLQSGPHVFQAGNGLDGMPAVADWSLTHNQILGRILEGALRRECIHISEIINRASDGITASRATRLRARGRLRLSCECKDDSSQQLLAAAFAPI
jgi:hypothetical protein